MLRIGVVINLAISIPFCYHIKRFLRRVLIDACCMSNMIYPINVGKMAVFKASHLVNTRFMDLTFVVVVVVVVG